jgi:hypothetical protein
MGSLRLANSTTRMCKIECPIARLTLPSLDPLP